MKRTLLILLLAASPALAQQAPPAIYTFTFTEAETNIVAEALSSAPMPWKVSNPILEKMAAAIRAQQPKPADPKPEAKPEP